MPTPALDNAAAAALYRLAHESNEHIGLLYEQDGKIQRTDTQSKNQQQKSKGRFRIPPGSLRAVFHNHPSLGSMKNSPETAKFSSDDIQQAIALKVPSYIAAGDRLRMYDPSTRRVSDVLAEFPIEEWKRSLLAKGLLR